jgi:hypothetical protein
MEWKIVQLVNTLQTALCFNLSGLPDARYRASTYSRHPVSPLRFCRLPTQNSMDSVIVQLILPIMKSRLIGKSYEEVSVVEKVPKGRWQDLLATSARGAEETLQARTH